MKKLLNHPLSIALIGVAMIATIAWAVDWQDHDPFSGDIANADDWLLRDVSDGANGTLKLLGWSALKTQMGNDANFWVGSTQAYLSGEIVVNNEATLYSALSDVDDFLQMGEASPAFGVNDATQGHPVIYGDNSSSGGKSSYYNAAGEDSNESYWTVEAAGDDFIIGPVSDPDMFTLDRSGGFTLTALANPILTLDDTAGNDFQIDLNNSNADFIMGSTSIFDIDTTDIVAKVPIEAPSIDAGILVEVISSSENFTSTEPDTMRKLFYMSSSSNANVEIEMQTSALGSGGDARELRFYNGEDGNYDLILDPNSTDQINLTGNGSCGAGSPVYCGESSSVVLMGVTASVWQASYVGACACTSQQ